MSGAMLWPCYRGEGGTHVMHGCSRMTEDPRISTLSERTEPVVFSTTREAKLAPSAKRREVFGELHEKLAASY